MNKGFQRLQTMNQWIKNGIERHVCKLLLPFARKVVLGAGGLRVPGWYSTDREILDLSDIRTFEQFWSGPRLSHFLAEHVWEHLDPETALEGIKICSRFLIDGGRLRIAVPDGRHPDTHYLEQVRPGGYGAGAHDHKVLYTVEELTDLVRLGGLEPIPLEWWDNKGVFHHMPWNPIDGPVKRSAENDWRNTSGLIYTSLIVDGLKKAKPSPTDNLSAKNYENLYTSH